ncbi:MAG: hypothetical protein H7Y86_06215 [Rhizobacter sp.]|nr:hypothetical protein [Ferruginibacter sp.]
MEDISFWVSEMATNDFPRLPVFQDKNLLVAITNFRDKNEYEITQQAIDNTPAAFKNSMLQLITTHSSMLLWNQQNLNHH